MASMYYTCADCGNEVQEITGIKTKTGTVICWNTQIGEYCDCCNNWNPEVVIAYR